MENSKKIVLFDIDYTLFDTDAYRKILYPRLAKELGLDEKELYIFRKEFEPEMKAIFGHFNPDFFLKKIQPLSKDPISIERLEEIFWEKALYSGVLDSNSQAVLSELRKSNITIGLLSTGDKRHQLAKVDVLLAYLPEINHHIFSNKIESLKDVLEIYAGYKVYIIDDLPEVLAKAKEINSRVMTILKRTKKVFETTNQVENFKPDFEIDNLREILKIVIN